MTPLITLIFGRGLMSVTVIAGIATFFPVLVNVSLALRSAPKAALDRCQAYGADAVTTLRKVQMPTALPARFASLRIAAGSRSSARSSPSGCRPARDSDT